jgi:hypothetical protein
MYGKKVIIGMFSLCNLASFLYKIIQGKKNLGHDKFLEKIKIKIVISHRTLATHIHGFNI